MNAKSMTGDISSMTIRKDFLTLTPADEFNRLLAGHAVATPPETLETVDAVGRVAAQDIPSPEQVPRFFRSTVDGYAVISDDTHGAGSSIPVYLDLAGEIPVGAPAHISLESGQSVRVVTGGAVPTEADAVVMQEHTDLIDETTLEIRKGVGHLENVIVPGEDIEKGDVLVRRGTRLRPHDIGALYAAGICRLPVHTRPQVALFSTGDEIVEPDRIPPEGCMRDINKYALSAAVIQAGGAPVRFENMPDDLDAVTKTIARGVKESDLVVLSGGSSVGAKDFTLSAIDALGKPGVLVHGIAVKPGKPTIFGIVDDTPIVGLPGHPMGALVIFLAFIVPFIRRIGGESDPTPFPSRTTAVLQRSVPGSPGRRTYIPVSLAEVDGTDVPAATPILGKSGIITTMMTSHGLLAIPENREGYAKGDMVTIFRYADIVG